MSRRTPGPPGHRESDRCLCVPISHRGEHDRAHYPGRSQNSVRSQRAGLHSSETSCVTSPGSPVIFHTARPPERRPGALTPVRVRSPCDSFFPHPCSPLVHPLIHRFLDLTKRRCRVLLPSVASSGSHHPFVAHPQSGRRSLRGLVLRIACTWCMFFPSLTLSCLCNTMNSARCASGCYILYKDLVYLRGDSLLIESEPRGSVLFLIQTRTTYSRRNFI
jgi:hypothetical protein